MQFKEALSKRIIELCNKYNYTPNRLAEMSYISPSTLRSIINNQVKNPSSLIVYKICKTLNITLKDFYDNNFFDMKNIED